MLPKLRMVLVEPAGALNVGSVARAMKNFGFTQLVLVKPRCDPFGSEARQMAVHAAELLAQAQLVASLPEALSGCQRVVGTTGRHGPLPSAAQIPARGLSWLLESTISATALVFGPEDRGLSTDELAYCQRFVTIPTDDAYASLNLAQAVAICCYELRQLAVAEVGFAPSDPGPPEAEITELEDYFAQLQTILLQIGYLYPHTARSRMAKFRALLNRAHPTAAEVAMLRGTLRQLNWALAHPPHRGDP